MNEELFKVKLQEAEDHYDAAWEEMARPEEDVVVYMVCKHAYNSVQHSLFGLLHRHGISEYPINSLQALLNECQKVDERFHALDLSPFLKLEDPEDVYMNIEVAKDHLNLAAKTKEMVAQDAKA